MSEELTRPERYAGLRHAFKVRAEIYKNPCFYCIHRDKDVLAWGRSVCKANNARSFPLCLKDNKAPAFEMDEAQVKEALR